MNDKIDLKEMSFLDIFLKNKYEIVIPSIQRDYVQGRTTDKAKKIRKDFISELKSYILNGGSHSLDFIYGYIDNTRFIPLDGQQRLTTLWLLHIYLGSIKGEKSTSFVLSYETRDSSTRFCKELLVNCDKVFSVENIKKEIKDKNSGKKRKIKPSELIMNEAWWFYSWLADPTVKGMLTMLDEIDSQFHDVVHEAYTNLFDNKIRPIVFEFLPLKEFHDIDDLYIKMNARGLPLTSFEIFKSKFIEDVEQYLPAIEKEFKADIDVNWSDTLWSHRDRGDKNIDHFLERALKVLLANEGPLARRESSLKPEDLDYLFEANNKIITFAHNWYEKRGLVFNSSLLKRLIADLKILLDSAHTALEHSNLFGYQTDWFDVVKAIERWIFQGKNVSDDGNLTYNTRLKIHAYLHFLQDCGDLGMSELSEWMRLIYNLSEAAGLDNSEDMVKALKSVEKLLDNFNTKRKLSNGLIINEWIAISKDLKPDFFPAYQWEEEVIKAQLRRQSNWKNLIDYAEHHPYLNGQIGITLYLSGVLPNKTPFQPLENIPSADIYKKSLDKVLPLFSQIGQADSKITKEFLMVKAMLSKDDYMPWLSSHRKNFYNRPGHRDYSWKRLFRIDDNSNIISLNCLKAIIDDSDFDGNQIEESLNKIISKCKDRPLWIKILTGKFGTNIMSHAKQGFIAFDNNNILIYHQSQRNHYHSELMTCILYEELKHIYQMKPEYISVKSQEEYCRINVNGYSICHWNGKWTVGGSYNEKKYDKKDDIIKFLTDSAKEK